MHSDKAARRLSELEISECPRSFVKPASDTMLGIWLRWSAAKLTPDRDTPSKLIETFQIFEAEEMRAQAIEATERKHYKR